MGGPLKISKPFSWSSPRSYTWMKTRLSASGRTSLRVFGRFFDEFSNRCWLRHPGTTGTSARPRVEALVWLPSDDAPDTGVGAEAVEKLGRVLDGENREIRDFARLEGAMASAQAEGSGR